MEKIIKQVVVCDRCGSIIYENDDYYKNDDISINDYTFDFCDKCYNRYMRFWNQFLRPDPTSMERFEPNEKIMYSINDSIVE